MATRVPRPVPTTDGKHSDDCQRVTAHVPGALGERGIQAQLIAVQGIICREVRDVRYENLPRAIHGVRGGCRFPSTVPGSMNPFR